MKTQPPCIKAGHILRMQLTLQCSSWVHTKTIQHLNAHLHLTLYPALSFLSYRFLLLAPTPVNHFISICFLGTEPETPTPSVLSSSCFLAATPPVVLSQSPTKWDRCHSVWTNKTKAFLIPLSCLHTSSSTGYTQAKQNAMTLSWDQEKAA